MTGILRRLGILLACVGWGAPPCQAAPSGVINVDFPTLIDQVGDQPGRFAVEVPQRVTIAADGQWTSSGVTRTWTYSIQVPTAVSMSFHAVHLVLPASAVLTVTGAKASVRYYTRDINRSSLWSRPLIGDTLSLSLTVAASDLASVQLDIDSLQAGYRGLGGVTSHPYFARRAAMRAATTSQNCQENYACDTSAANQGPGHATVAVVVGNLYQCTGTLLNDTRNDLTPYVLTARHCENGALGGGAPQAAGSVTIYWDAIAPCGTALSSIYDSSTPVQGGATTVVEQQDAWLMKLDNVPVATDAYWAGWDATGGIFTGGYSIHHALGYNKQYVSWYGQALLQQIPAKTLSIGYDSTFWGVVNQLGSVGAGASGGALFDADSHLVGSATLAALQNGANSAGVCPVNPPSVPTADTVTADYTALSAVFASTADATSSTGSTTLQSALDPTATGLLVMSGVSQMAVSLIASNPAPTTMNTLGLTWSAPGAQSCIASGGVAGDGWAGTKAGSGTVAVANLAGGQVTYSLACTGMELVGHASTQVDWTYDPPSISLNGPPETLALGSSVLLTWGSNVSPCVASGGTAGDGWAGFKVTQGQQTVIPTHVGAITYTLTCGSGLQMTTSQTTVNIAAVDVTMSADSTQVRIGSTVTLSWASTGQNYACSAAGGSATDGWAQQVYENSPGFALITESAAGTYTYTIHCTGGGQTAASSATVVFTNDPPTLSLTAISPTQQISAPGTQQGVTFLQWYSNTPQCFMSSLGPLSNTSVAMQGQYPSGTVTGAESIAGQYTYQLQCGANSTSTNITWINPNPTVTLTSPSTTWVANQPGSLSWTTNTEPCTQSGGASGDGWAGAYSAGQATDLITEAAAGNYTFILTCGIGISTGQATLNVTIPPPAVTISATPNTTVAGTLVTLNWNSSIAPCTSIDPNGGVDWGGSLVAPSSFSPILENSIGTFTYSITCGTGSRTVHASTQVTVTAPVPIALSAGVTSVAVNTPVTLHWTSPLTGCVANGGNGADGWSGSEPQSGSVTVTSAQAGSFTYGILCGGELSAGATVTYFAPSGSLSLASTPTASLISDHTTQAADQSVTLTWSSQHATSCFASGGTSGDGWTGNLAVSGSMQVTESTGATDTYVITCIGAPPAAKAQVSVAFAEASSSGSSGGHSGGGGGIDKVTLLLLSLVLLLRTDWRISRRDDTHRVDS